MCTYNGKRERNWERGGGCENTSQLQSSLLSCAPRHPRIQSANEFTEACPYHLLSLSFTAPPRAAPALSTVGYRDATRRDARCRNHSPVSSPRFLPAPRSGMYRVIAFEGWLKFPRDTIRLLFASSHSRESILHPLHLDLEKHPPRRGKAETAGGFN